MATKVKRDAFLYLEPHGDGRVGGNFAQCASCALYVGARRRCLIHGDIKVEPDASCGFYAPGENRFASNPAKLVTPEESGLVRRQVRCENCTFFDRPVSECDLFKALNRAKSDIFDLDVHVKSHGCCNAQTPRGSAGAVTRALRTAGQAVARKRAMA